MYTVQILNFLPVFSSFFFFFFFNDTATTEIYTLSLHDALPIWRLAPHHDAGQQGRCHRHGRSEEHTSELQSRLHLVCRLLLEKKKKKSYKEKLVTVSTSRDTGEERTVRS